jgi:hypothetical protein
MALPFHASLKSWPSPAAARTVAGPSAQVNHILTMKRTKPKPKAKKRNGDLTPSRGPKTPYSKERKAGLSQHGNRGNPAGRPVGARTELSEQFLQDPIFDFGHNVLVDRIAPGLLPSPPSPMDAVHRCGGSAHPSQACAHRACPIRVLLSLPTSPQDR